MVAIPEAGAIKIKKGNGDRRRKELATALFVAVLSRGSRQDLAKK